MDLLPLIKGTPMFVARSVASTSLLFEDNPAVFVKMPELGPDALSVYVDAYTRHTYDTYSDKEGRIHGTIMPPIGFQSEPAQKTFYHRPDHDVESIFWVLLATLMRAQPQVLSDNVDLSCYWDAYDCFLAHTI